MTTIKLERYVLYARCDDEPSGLVTSNGSEDYIFTSKEAVLTMAGEMRMHYPDTEYTPYQLVPLLE